MFPLEKVVVDIVGLRSQQLENPSSFTDIARAVIAIHPFFQTGCVPQGLKQHVVKISWILLRCCSSMGICGCLCSNPVTTNSPKWSGALWLHTA